MKHKLLDALQVILAVIITGSTAFAMQPPKEQLVAKPAPIVQEKAAEPLKVVKTAVEPPKVETPVVEPPKAPEIKKPDSFYKEFIYGKESGNCPTKWEGEYGECPAYHGVPTGARQGYGLCQATPANKMAVMGAGWETSYDLQDKWCSQHAQQYGGWAGAYAFWLSNKWW